MKTNQSPAETAKSNVLQADPVLLSVLSKLTECRISIEEYAKANIFGEFDPLRELTNDFSDDIYDCISRIGDMVGHQIVNLSQNMVSDE